MRDSIMTLPRISPGLRHFGTIKTNYYTRPVRLTFPDYHATVCAWIRHFPGALMSINIMQPTTHIWQVDPEFCWAAALAMITGRHSMDGVLHVMDMATAAGVRNLGTNPRLSAADVQRVVHALHLRRFPAPSPLTVDSLAAHLRQGPCALFVALRSRPMPNGHVYVLSGMRGDGTDSTMLTLQDPYQATGTSTVSFQDFLNVTISSVDHIVHR
jgi:hypothetical protein